MSQLKNLEPGQYAQLVDALVDAFPMVQDVRLMLRYTLGWRLDELMNAEQGTINVVFELLIRTEARDQSLKLIAGARRVAPENMLLAEAASRLGLAPETRSLERYIEGSNLPLHVADWRTREGYIEPRVCRIRVRTNRGNLYGTGFLLAADVVMTNYHVVEPVILGRENKTTGDGLTAAPAGVVFRFDYIQTPNSILAVDEGREVGLATQGEWCLDSSRYSPLDEQAAARQASRDTDQLDYALLRLEKPVGDDDIGYPGRKHKRGWLTPAEDLEPREGEPLVIMQHPHGQPLQIAGDAVLDMNENRTRVNYRTITERGSSGAPCFNFNWELIGLHHAGDPDYQQFQHADYNSGVPFTRIRELMESRGSWQHVGKKSQ